MIILFQINVFGGKINGTALAMYLIKIRNFWCTNTLIGKLFLSLPRYGEKYIEDTTKRHADNKNNLHLTLNYFINLFFLLLLERLLKGPHTRKKFVKSCLLSRWEVKF